MKALTSDIKGIGKVYGQNKDDVIEIQSLQYKKAEEEGHR